MSTAQILTDAGHEVFEAADANAALKALQAEAVDVLLTDVGLPGMSGSELARQVREAWPEVLIVFASGDDAGWVEAGIPDALQLSKPYTAEALIQVLQNSRRR